MRMLLVVFTFCFAGALSPAWAQPRNAQDHGLATASNASPAFDVDQATEAWLARLPADARTRSDAYFEGGYWLQLWDFLAACAIALLLLELGWSTKMRALAERITRFRPLQTFLYWVQYLIVTALLDTPLAIYEGYFREHQYGLATQTFGPWAADQLKTLAITLVFGGLLIVALFGAVRRQPRRWWITGSVLTAAFSVLSFLIAPVYLVPIFNKVTRLDDPRITAPILSMARANGIPARDVYQIDASRQTTRISANVSGIGSTMRITLNDNLLRRGSPEEIQAVMGHEMGHYVMGHVYALLVFTVLLVVLAFALLSRAIQWSLSRRGVRWGIRGITDPAVLPVAVLWITVLSFVATPVSNTFTRTQEHQADIFGLDASRQPDGFAQAALDLAQYRKLRPGPVEEWIFFDHPSGYRRIHDAMQWKAENLR